MTNLIQELDITTPEVIRLHETIKSQIAATERQTKTMTRLTWATLVLAFVQVVLALVELCKG